MHCMFELTKRYYFDIEAQLAEQVKYVFQHIASLYLKHSSWSFTKNEAGFLLKNT